MLASVIICTYNRSTLLAASLDAMIKQDYPADQFEVIVVDNNSTDDTRSATELLSASSPVSVRYVRETSQGLSFARNRGIAEASGEIIVFVDDDIHAEENWLKEIVSPFEDPAVACAGGPVLPVWPFEKPEWLTEGWQWCYSVNEYLYPKVRETGEMNYPYYPLGANVAFRKNIFDRVGTFDTNLGRIGNSLLSNDETELCSRIESSGARLKFAERAVIHHKISPERLRNLWILHRLYWEGRSKAVYDLNAGFDIYSRLKEHAVKAAASSSSAEQTIGTRCNEREAIGYLYQLVMQQPNDFRRLRALKTFMRAVSASSGTVEAKEAELKQKEQQFVQLASEFHNAVAYKDRQIEDLLNSLSWKVTAPLRWCLSTLMRIKRPTDR